MNGFIYEPGEVYDITIKGARVISVAHNGWIRFDVPDGPRHEIAPYSDAFTVERVAPAEWPPRPGDVWRTERQSYFAVDDSDPDEDNCDRPTIRLVNTGGEHLDPDFILLHGPLTLVHREDEQDGAEDSTAPTAGTAVPGRPGRVVGDCGHPVWEVEWYGGRRTCQPCEDGGAR